MIVSKYVGLWQVLQYGDTTETLICNYNLLFSVIHRDSVLVAGRMTNTRTDQRLLEKQSPKPFECA